MPARLHAIVLRDGLKGLRWINTSLSSLPRFDKQ